jgi:branched-chain amino acid transport system permease protein
LVAIAFDSLTLIILNGLYYAFSLFLISLGLNILYGVMRILNIAHGGFYAMGAFFTWYLMKSAFDAGFPSAILWLCIFGGALMVGVVGMAIEPLLYRRLYKKQEEYSLLATFGLMLVLDDILRLLFGSNPLSAGYLYSGIGSVLIFGWAFPTYNFVIYIFALIVALTLWLLLFKTNIGKITRATSQDSEMSSALGVNTSLHYTKIFTLAVAIAGLGGAVYLPATSAYPGMGFEAIVLSFVVMVVGGLGSLKGAMIGAIIIGLVRAFGIFLFPEFELAAVFVILVIVLVFRPIGLCGRKFTREER